MNKPPAPTAINPRRQVEQDAARTNPEGLLAENSRESMVPGSMPLLLIPKFRKQGTRQALHLALSCSWPAGHTCNTKPLNDIDAYRGLQSQNASLGFSWTGSCRKFATEANEERNPTCSLHAKKSSRLKISEKPQIERAHRVIARLTSSAAAATCPISDPFGCVFFPNLLGWKTPINVEHVY